MKTVAVDIDGVVADAKDYDDDRPWDQKYAEACLVQGAGQGLRSLVDDGFKVVLHTARWECNRATTLEWLTEHGLKHGTHWHELVCDKLSADVYIDDRAYRFRSWEDVIEDLCPTLEVRSVRGPNPDGVVTKYCVRCEACTQEYVLGVLGVGHTTKSELFRRLGRLGWVKYAPGGDVPTTTWNRQMYLGLPRDWAVWSREEYKKRVTELLLDNKFCPRARGRERLYLAQKQARREVYGGV